MIKIPFKKLHGAGNDFIIVKYDDFPYEERFSELAAKCCHRRFGIGADGLMIVAASQRADYKMYYYNSDGSRGNMCGNGIRCFSKYLYDEGLINQRNFNIETLAGIKAIKVTLRDNKVETVNVNMGEIVLDPSCIPVKTERKIDFINQDLEVGDKRFVVSSVLMGVPHTVIFTDEFDADFIEKYGPMIENHPIFPEKTNVNFAKIIDRKHIKVGTWERGAGHTLACGTGVTSVCGVAYLLNLIDSSVWVDVEGGKLKIRIHQNQQLEMEGPAEDICTGTFFLR